MTESRIVIVGAGVAGLTTALELSKSPSYKITICAKYMPGDYDIEYASPWAGANYLPVSKEGSLAAECDRNTWPELERLARDHPEAGIHFQDTIIHANRTEAGNTLYKTDPWFKDVLPDFRAIPADELRGFDHGTRFTSVCINTSIYLPWLVSQCLKAGVVLRRAVLKHIAEAANCHHSGNPADLVVNCTGLGAAKLGGVMDRDMTPVRGQTVLVRNDCGVMAHTSITEDGEDEMCYIMGRAAGGGTLLGGCYQIGNWDSQVDPNLATRIMKRAVDLCPALTGGKGIEHLSIIRQGVGLRPVRNGGVRLEKEEIGEVWIVHNYGHGGFGYQASYGCSQVAVRLVEEALKQKSKV